MEKQENKYMQNKSFRNENSQDNNSFKKDKSFKISPENADEKDYALNTINQNRREKMNGLNQRMVIESNDNNMNAGNLSGVAGIANFSQNNHIQKSSMQLLNSGVDLINQGGLGSQVLGQIPGRNSAQKISGTGSYQIQQNSGLPKGSQPHQKQSQHDQLKASREQIKQLEAKIEMQNNQKETADQKSQMMAQLMTSLDIENDTQKRHIQELEQFVGLLTAALTENNVQSSKGEAALIKQFANQFNLNMNIESIEQKSKKEKNKTLPEKITVALGRMDLLLKENFELKREIVFERKKYQDLQQAFQDLRHNVSSSDINIVAESPDKSPFGQQQRNSNLRPSNKSSASAYERMSANPNLWHLEKNQMQQTILTLSEEVEYLSVRNQKMITDLKRKDPFYETYVKTSEELTKLRQAHAILISMIKTNKINLKYQDAPQQESFTERIMGSAGIDKFELQVPQNQVNNYRGGTSLKDLKNSYQNQNQQMSQNVQHVHPNPLFCGFGNNMKEQPKGFKPISYSSQREMNVGEILSCGTMMRGQNPSNQPEQPGRRRNISKDKRQNLSQTELERQVMNNEYLKILKDPKFSDLNVNFLEF